MTKWWLLLIVLGNGLMLVSAGVARMAHASLEVRADDEMPMAMSREEAQAHRAHIIRAELEQDHEARRLAWENRTIHEGREGEHAMRFKLRVEGERPATGWPLFISLHGGGEVPPEVNDQQWANQIKLYQFEQAMVIAPRAPTDRWNLWHEPHIDRLLDRLISAAVQFGGADRNRVYLMGYSAGGDGVYQLAPRMADRFAAATMSAGHPNEADPMGLRNLPFAIHMGANDTGVNRNSAARVWGERLARLREEDPAGYVHSVTIHPEFGHWMKQHDGVAIPWMLQHTRNAVPTRVVWKQDDVTHDRLHWLAVPSGQAKVGSVVAVRIEGQRVIIEHVDGVDRLIIRLDDRLLNLDQPVVVQQGDNVLFEGIVARSREVQRQTFHERGDPDLIFDAMIEVTPIQSAPADKIP